MRFKPWHAGIGSDDNEYLFVAFGVVTFWSEADHHLIVSRALRKGGSEPFESADGVS